LVGRVGVLDGQVVQPELRLQRQQRLLGRLVEPIQTKWPSRET
jgi:hypothetical protein